MFKTLSGKEIHLKRRLAVRDALTDARYSDWTQQDHVDALCFWLVTVFGSWTQRNMEFHAAAAGVRLMDIVENRPKYVAHGKTIKAQQK